METIYHNPAESSLCKLKARLRRRLLPALLIALVAASLNFIFPLASTAWDGLRGQPAHLSGPCDFVAFWAAGRMAAAGQGGEVYDIRPLFAEEAKAPTDPLQLPFAYPPTGLLLPFLVRGLPFFVGLAVWTFGMTLAAVALLRAAGLPWAVVALSCLSPAALLNVGLGQFGLLLGAVALASLALLRRRPGASGLLLGLTVIKPQAALLLPAVMAAGRYWRALAGAVLGGAGLCASSAALFGLAPWRGFFGAGAALAHFMLVQPFPSGPLPALSSYELYGTSVLWMLRSFGCGLAVSATGQAAVTAGAALLCWRIWRKPSGDNLARLVLTLCLGILATPYGYLYDLCGASAAMAALSWRQRRVHLADGLLWVWPMLGLIIAIHLRLELTPLAVAAAAWRTRTLL